MMNKIDFTRYEDVVSKQANMIYNEFSNDGGFDVNDIKQELRIRVIEITRSKKFNSLHKDSDNYVRRSLKNYAITLSRSLRFKNYFHSENIDDYNIPVSEENKILDKIYVDNLIEKVLSSKKFNEKSKSVMSDILNGFSIREAAKRNKISYQRANVINNYFRRFVKVYDFRETVLS